ncbi:acyl-CoA dehydrogenase [Verminephrobacter eiseniae]|uniref:acyl-CoA dehydrogenase family protein n=1 Tax=Verminephrobacter eiseniae TaxID=364317 RepID=UPI0022390143|nr:acyl-CoA dehydrogenase family protein [Verminephrobacter eiseniae]MCW5262096.1 acyl-CoA dehydrogenase [Verminephrobacter eiseniae]
MDFSISATDRQRLQTLRRLGREEMRPAGWRADRAAAPLPVDDPFFARMLAQGFGRTRWRPAGAAGADSADSADAAAPNKAASAVAQVLLAEEGAYWDRGIGVALPGPGLGEPPLLALGTPGQQERFLAPFVAPQRPIWGAFAMTEPSGGSDVANIKTRARRDGDHWVLNGAKSFSGNSGRAEWIVVFATIDPALGRAGHRAFVVERGTPGLGDFRVEKKMGLRAYESTSFLLSDCRVPMANLLGGEAGHGQPTGGFKGAMNTFNAGRPAIAGMAVGMGRAALDEAMACMCEAGLASEQRLRDRLERSRRKLKAALLLALRAAWLADQRQPNMLEASAAKALAPPAAFEAASFAMEVLGAAGGRGDHLIEKLFRDVKALDIVEGTGQIQRVVMARHLVGLPN